MRVQARYDAAQTNADNSNHWLAADDLSSRAALTPDVRRTIRRRARYEVANNSLLRGMLGTLSSDLIGTGPRLQLQGDADATSQIESAWRKWCAQCSLAAKLRTARIAKAVDGEAFLAITTNRRLSPVSLDVVLIEADQIETPYQIDGFVDGIRFDADGNPDAYAIMRTHPGDTLRAQPTEYRTVDSRNVIHWFRADRPGQIRGVSELASNLSEFAELRRYTRAVVAAAETAADFAVLLHTNAPPGDEDDVDPFVEIPLDKRLMTTLPAGWQANQMRAEQPTTNYEMFVRACVRQAARAHSMPLNVALGDSSGYNYSSGRLDHQVYHRAIAVERDECGLVVIDHVFREWLAEYMLLPGSPRIALDEWRWQWDGFQHVDPLKEANASARLKDIGLLTDAEYFAEQGRDWRTAYQQLALEQQERERLGIRILQEEGARINIADQEDE